VIGSAAGVALMGIEKVDFVWYAKKITLSALLGYMGGIGVYLAQESILHGNAFANNIPESATSLLSIFN
jgi:hypothetical protein